ARCDFDEQVSVATDDGSQRPDLVVRLAGGKNIVVDSKVSLAAYLEAAEAADEAVRDARLGAHARHLREHVDRLSAKAYWAGLSPSRGSGAPGRCPRRGAWPTRPRTGPSLSPPLRPG